MKRDPWESLEKRIRPEKLSKRQEQYWDVLMFLLRMMILSVPLYIILSAEGLLYHAQVLTAGLTNIILNAMGIPASQEGFLITVADPGSPFMFFIDTDCTGWKSVMFLFALMFAVKGPGLKSRLLGFFAGSLVVLAGNMGRILTTVLAERAYGPGFAIMLHDYLFRIGLVGLVLGIWAFWLAYLNKKFK